MTKIFSVLFVTFLIPLSVFAQDATGSLKQNMKQLGALSKTIGATVKDPSKNQDNAVNAEKMANLFKVVFTQAEDGVQNLPADQQQAAIADFQGLIQQEFDLATQLQAAFAANDNATATAIFQKMSDIKHQGHDRFDP